MTWLKLCQLRYSNSMLLIELIFFIHWGGDLLIGRFTADGIRSLLQKLLWIATYQWTRAETTYKYVNYIDICFNSYRAGYFLYVHLYAAYIYVYLDKIWFGIWTTCRNAPTISLWINDSVIAALFLSCPDMNPCININIILYKELYINEYKFLRIFTS